MEKQDILCDRKCFKLWKAATTPPERVAAMSTPEARAKSLATIRAQRSAPDYVHPMLGHVFTDESLTKMRESAVGKHDGELNGMKGRNHREDSKEKMSDGHSQNLVDGKGFVYGGNGHVSGWHTSPKGNIGVRMFYRSSWERDMMFHLDSNDDVSSYGYECVRIPYYDIDNHKRNYVPDFLVTYSDGRRVLVEIKPKQFLDNEKTKLKADAAWLYCFANGIDVYEILTGEDLRSRQII